MRPDIAHVADALRDRIAELAQRVYPEGAPVRGGREWRCGSSGKISIKLTGPNKGLWSDYAADLHGDPLDMIAHVMHHGDKRRALAWARDYLGMGDGDWKAAAEAAARRREAARKIEDRSREAARGRAAAEWLSASAELRGTLAETYLRARAIDIDALPKIPAAIRFRADATCIEDDPDWRPHCGRPRPTRPAIIAGLWVHGEATPRCVQRTFLAPDGSAKAPLKDPRKTLGSWPGALCPISRGPTGRRVRDMEPGETVAIGEGLEEGLSIALARPEWRVFACLYVGNFGRVRLPQPCHLVLCPNNDRADSAAAEAFRKAVLEQRKAGHRVEVLRAPQPHKDWNDFLRAVS